MLNPGSSARFYEAFGADALPILLAIIAAANSNEPYSRPLIVDVSTLPVREEKAEQLTDLFEEINNAIFHYILQQIFGAWEELQKCYEKQKHSYESQLDKLKNLRESHLLNLSKVVKEIFGSWEEAIKHCFEILKYLRESQYDKMFEVFEEIGAELKPELETEIKALLELTKEIDELQSKINLVQNELDYLNSLSKPSKEKFQETLIPHIAGFQGNNKLVVEMVPIPQEWKKLV